MSEVEHAEAARPRTGSLVWAALLLLLLAGLVVRLWGIGRLGLVADEGHQALAVEAILAHGIPEVPSANVYLRGAPFLYSEAAAARIGGVSETTLRLPAAIFGTLSILATFVLARRLFGVGPALLAAFLITFSLWELELSRYARMYTLLQLLFVMAAYAFIRGELDDRRGWRIAMLVLMTAAILTHQLGVMILLIFLVPAFLDDEQLPERLRGARRYRLAVAPAVLGVLWLFVHRQIGAWMVRVAEPGPVAEADAPASGVLGLLEQHVRVPEMTMPLNLLGTDRPAILGALAVFAFFAVCVAVVGARQPGRRLRALYCLAILGAAFFNLFAVAIGLAIGAVILYAGGLRQFTRTPWTFAWAGTLALALYWSVYLLLRPAALDPGWGEPWTIAEVFGSYPPFKSRVLDWFLNGWPRTTALVGVGLAGLAAVFVSDRRNTAALAAIAIVLLPMTAVTFGRDAFNEVRYHFHLYPFLIITFALVISFVARGLTAGLDILLAALGRGFRSRRVVLVLLHVVLAVFLCRDVAPGDIGLFIRRDYATFKDPIRATLNWRPYANFHQDHVGPAQFVSERLEPGDRVMFFGPTYWASIYLHYIGQVDYAVSEKASRLYRDGHVVHHVSGARCIVSVEELVRVLDEERDHRIWLLGDLNLLSAESAHFSDAMRLRLDTLARPYHYLGRDANTLVRCIDPGPGRVEVSSLGESR